MHKATLQAFLLNVHNKPNISEELKEILLLDNIFTLLHLFGVSSLFCFALKLFKSALIVFWFATWQQH